MTAAPPLPPPAPAACYGLACPQRGTCALFTALGIDDGHVIDSCQTRAGWPMYRPGTTAADPQPRLIRWRGTAP